MSVRDELAGLVNLPDEELETLVNWLAEHDERIVTEILKHVDSSPAVTWTGKGGAKDLIQQKFLQK